MSQRSGLCLWKRLTSLQCINTDLTRIYDDGVIPTAAVLPAEGGILRASESDRYRRSFVPLELRLRSLDSHVSQKR